MRRCRCPAAGRHAGRNGSGSQREAGAGARVSLLRSLTVIEERQTDAKGVYKFEGLQEGAYQLAASARGLACPAMDIASRQRRKQRQDMNLAFSALESQVVVSASLGGALAPADRLLRQPGFTAGNRRSRRAECTGGYSRHSGHRGQPAGRHGGVTGVYIRGGESKYNAVMVDGIPMNEFGGAFDMASLPADGIERMEVTRGPQSALYGSNAMTGVINIVSRRGEGPPTFTALAEGGSYSTRRFATGGSGLTEGFSWSYNLSRLDSDGVVENDNYRNQSAFLSLGYNQASSAVELSAFSATQMIPERPDPTDPIRPARSPGIDTVSRGKQNLFGYQLAYTEQISSRVRAGYHRQPGHQRPHSINSNIWGDYRSAKSARNIQHAKRNHALTPKTPSPQVLNSTASRSGHDYITDSQSQPFLLPRTSLAYFVENRWSPSNRLYLIAGIRIDNMRTHSIPPDAWGSRPSIPESSVVKVNPRVSVAYCLRQEIPDSLLGRTRGFTEASARAFVRRTVLNWPSPTIRS